MVGQDNQKHKTEMGFYWTQAKRVNTETSHSVPRKFRSSSSEIKFANGPNRHSVDELSPCVLYEHQIKNNVQYVKNHKKQDQRYVRESGTWLH
jgi:hypothetical protein